MGKFEYAVLGRKDNNWKVAGVDPKITCQDILEILNDLGARGWEIVTPFNLGGDSRTELVPKWPIH